jgi:hypothetical protein
MIGSVIIFWISGSNDPADRQIRSGMRLRRASDGTFEELAHALLDGSGGSRYRLLGFWSRDRYNPIASTQHRRKVRLKLSILDVSVSLKRKNAFRPSIFILTLIKILSMRSSFTLRSTS